MTGFVLFCTFLLLWPGFVDYLIERDKPSRYWAAKVISWKRLLEIDKQQEMWHKKPHGKSKQDEGHRQ
jgi:hypothetical protein